MKIGIDLGHTLNGLGTGATGILKETDVNREVGKLVIKYLKDQNHTVIDCTVDRSTKDLADRVQKANAQPLDLFISIHLNAGGGSGTETYVYSTSSKAYSYAKNIQSKIVSKCKFKDRGVKTANFYVLKNTISPALLLELFFIDTKADCDNYNPDTLAKAIVEGITGKPVTTSNITTNNSSTIYRVIAGSYKQRSNADKVLNDLKNKGYSAFIEVKN